jgi:hypothetical protein
LEHPKKETAEGQSEREKPPTATLSEQELERVLTAVEDENDVLALQQVKKEQAEAAQLDDDLDDTILIQRTEESTTINTELMSQLTDLERYALRFLEKVDPIVDMEAIAVAHQKLEEEAKAWEQDAARRFGQTKQVRLFDTHTTPNNEANNNNDNLSSFSDNKTNDPEKQRQQQQQSNARDSSKPNRNVNSTQPKKRQKRKQESDDKDYIDSDNDDSLQRSTRPQQKRRPQRRR